jgi:hypothetical protein
VRTIERNLSLEGLGPTKTSRNRRLTVGATTAAMVVEHFDTWTDRVGEATVVADRVFAPDYRRLTHARANLLSHRFDRLRRAAGLPNAALHRLVTASAPNSSRTASSERRKPGSGTETPPQPCATTHTLFRSMTLTSPTASMTCSTAAPVVPSDHVIARSTRAACPIDSVAATRRYRAFQPPQTPEVVRSLIVDEPG